MSRHTKPPRNKEERIEYTKRLIEKELALEEPDAKYVASLRMDLHYLTSGPTHSSGFREQLAQSMAEQMELDAERRKAQQERNKNLKDAYGNPYVFGKVYGE